MSPPIAPGAWATTYLRCVTCGHLSHASHPPGVLNSLAALKSPCVACDARRDPRRYMLGLFLVYTRRPIEFYVRTQAYLDEATAQAAVSDMIADKTLIGMTTDDGLRVLEPTADFMEREGQAQAAQEERRQKAALKRGLGYVKPAKLLPKPKSRNPKRKPRKRT